MAVIAVALWPGLGGERCSIVFRASGRGTRTTAATSGVRAWPLVTRFPLAGVGGGGYSAAELATRTTYEGSFISVSAHNEYLEALIEGGIVRFTLTIVLAVAVVWGAARRYWRTRDPLVLGCLFGLSAVAIHAFGEFGIHMPSIALTAAVVAACAARRRREDGPGEAETVPAITTRSGTITAGAVLVLAALLVVLADSARTASIGSVRMHRWQCGPPMPPGSSKRQRRVRPNDPNVWEELASAHLQAAAEEGQAALSGLVGFAEVANPSDILPGSDPDHHVTEALKAARAGRNTLPLVAGFHLRLGTFAGRFARSEAARVHFDRAIRVGSSLPDVWFIAGQAAADRGDWPTALFRLAGIARALSPTTHGHRAGRRGPCRPGGLPGKSTPG